MTRSLALVVLLVAGCGRPSSSVDRHVEGVTAPELRFRVVMTDITRAYPRLTVHATVISSTATWAGLRDLDIDDLLIGPSPAEGPGTGPARRLEDGITELEIQAIDLPLEEWADDGAYERNYALVLDAAPTEPWDVILTATVSGNPTGTAVAEIVLDP